MEKVAKTSGRKFQLLREILAEKCPNCGKGEVYKKTSVFKLPLMNKCCSDCKYHFDRESGYFIGAMYISYGLAVSQGIIAFLLAYFIFNWTQPMSYLLLISAVILLFSRKNYSLSRVIFMKIFPW